MLSTNFAPGEELANSVAIQSDGKILAAGVAGLSGISANFAVARYLPDGGLDASFHDDGKLQIAFAASSEESAHAMALHAGGRIVLAGTTNAKGSGDFALVRILSNTVNAFVEDSKLFILGDASDNFVEIVDSGRGSFTVLESGRQIGTFTGIERIIVDMQAGNDRVEAVVGDIVDTTFSFQANLGRGDDTCVITHQGGMGGDGQFLVKVLGDQGNDEVNFLVAIPAAPSDAGARPPGPFRRPG